MKNNYSDSLISYSKNKFNDFFQKYLYGSFDNDDNTILSRGIWEDTFIKYPDLFKFAINLSIDNQWNGYSDSLGHDNVFEKLVPLCNLEGDFYTTDNCALTLGNVTGLSFVFLHLNKILVEKKEEKGTLLSISPFYPSILDSAKNYFNVDFIDSFQLSEDELFFSIKDIIELGGVDIFLIPNFIGVDGRTYSKDFFDQLIDYLNSKGIYLIIDELTWYNPLEYPENINTENVIRMVSLSKMYGIPGMKLGFMLGSEDFISGYYNTASSGYGGPASNFFLLQEFIYLFEKNRISGHSEIGVQDIDNLSNKYSIDPEILGNLYENYIETIKENYDRFNENYQTVKDWALKNEEYFEYYNLNQDNPAINTIFQLKGINDFSFFVSLISLYKTSIFPGSCIGFQSDNVFRINFLEEKLKLERGLCSITNLLSKYKKNISDRIKLVLIDNDYLDLLKNIEEVKELLGFKGIELRLLQLNTEPPISNTLISTNLAVKNLLISSDSSSKIFDLVKDLIGELGITLKEILYIGEEDLMDGVLLNRYNHQEIEKISSSSEESTDLLKNFILLET